MNTIKFTGIRKDNLKPVTGYYFKTPLTSENFEADSFQSGKVRHCISDDNGVVFEIYPEPRLSSFDENGYDQNIYYLKFRTMFNRLESILDHKTPENKDEAIKIAEWLRGEISAMHDHFTKVKDRLDAWL